MGVVLEIGKLVATVWLKQHWTIAPWSIRLYLFMAILVLMLLTSMGIFGYLSKAHSDQNLVSGDVVAKLAIYDEKIKTTKENIEIKRRELKQMDEAVDQVMARSQNEQGADKSIALRKSQQRDRTRISSEIETEQKRLSELNNETAPIRAQVRQVEAEVGPLKYIAALIYGDELDSNLLEKSVRWVIILIVVIFDPLAVVLLLASQYSFAQLRKPDESALEETVNDPVKIEPQPIRVNNKFKDLYLEKELHHTVYYDVNFKLPKTEPVDHDYLFVKGVYTPPDSDRVPIPVYKEPVQETVSKSTTNLGLPPEIEKLINENEYVVIDGETMHRDIVKERYMPRISISRSR